MNTINTLVDVEAHAALETDDLPHGQAIRALRAAATAEQYQAGLLEEELVGAQRRMTRLLADIHKRREAAARYDAAADALAAQR